MHLKVPQAFKCDANQAPWLCYPEKKQVMGLMERKTDHQNTCKHKVIKHKFKGVVCATMLVLSSGVYYVCWFLLYFKNCVGGFTSDVGFQNKLLEDKLTSVRNRNILASEETSIYSKCSLFLDNMV